MSHAYLVSLAMLCVSGILTLPAWLNAVLSISVSIVGDKPMLNVFTKSIIASSAYVSICSYAYYTLFCRVKAV